MIITVTLNASIDRTCLINNFSPKQINRCDEPIELAGGKGLNVTRALKTFGQEVIATGFIGGKTGERLEELMNLDNIKHDFFKIKGKTRYCLAIIDEENKAITEINENGPNITKEETEAFFQKLEVLAPEAKILVISGSVPKSLPKDIYANLIELGKKRGLITFLDASGEALKKGIGAKPYVIKPNRTEAEELLGFKLETEEDFMKGIYFLCEYCNIACITLEDKGCVIGIKSEIYHIIPPKIEIVNSVGSGDSFLAGFINNFIKNKSLSEIGSLAIATGSANAMTDRAGFCRLEDINSILEKIVVKKLL